jgi:hypothetical protein
MNMTNENFDVEKFLLKLEQKNMPWLFEERGANDYDEVSVPISPIYDCLQKHYTHRRCFNRIF